jgi:hypothetical protein
LRKYGIKDLFYSCIWMGFQSWNFCILFLTTTEHLVQFFFTILCQRVLYTALLSQDISYKTSMKVFLWCIVCISNVSENCSAERSSNTHRATYLLTYLLTYSLTYLLTHLLTHSLTYLLTYLLTHSLTHSLTYSLTYLLSYLLTYLLTYLLIHSIQVHGVIAQGI